MKTQRNRRIETRRMPHQPTVNSIAIVMRSLGKGRWIRLSDILSTATADFNITPDADALLAVIRDLYRQARVQHKKDGETHLFRLSQELKGLGWVATQADGGMFLDTRNKTRTTRRSPVVAWLNCRKGRFSVNVTSDVFHLTCPIPARVTDLGDAVQWVYDNAIWR